MIKLEDCLTSDGCLRTKMGQYEFVRFDYLHRTAIIKLEDGHYCHVNPDNLIPVDDDRYFLNER